MIMSNSVSQFFKDNRKDRDNEKYAATKRFVDDKGEAIEWVLRPLSSKRVDFIRKNAKDDDELSRKLTAEAVVFPNLRDTGLQDSYGVKKPEDLLYELMYPDELIALEMKVLEMNGFDKNLIDYVNIAKNS